jgi:hypothetical protein
MNIFLILSSQKLSVAEIVTQFRGEAAIWDPAEQAMLANFLDSSQCKLLLGWNDIYD